MKKLLLTTAFLAFSAPAYAIVVPFTVCGPSNGNGCELADEQKIFLDEIHDSSLITGNVGSNNSGPVVHITADVGTFDSFLDTGGGFATIDASHGFKGFNGVTIDIPGYTFTDLVFEVQMTRLGGRIGDAELDGFHIRPFSDFIDLDGSFAENDSPDALFQFNVLTTNKRGFTSLDLFADNFPLSAGFFEIKHLQVSGLAASVPEPSTWAMLIAGFGLMGLLGYRRTRQAELA